MIFAYLCEEILSGEKTQTRRIVTATQGITAHAEGTIVTYKQVGRYAVGKTYAVQPGRGQKAIARIRITDIRREDVRNISNADAVAEGFFGAGDFLEAWTSMHDKPAWKASHETNFENGDESGIIGHVQGWMSWLKGTRPAKRYDAWVLTFEVVK